MEDLDTTKTESSLNSKESVQAFLHLGSAENIKNSPRADTSEYVYSSPHNARHESPPRPLTPPQRLIESCFSPSPGFERRLPSPFALQGSPARSSLVQKSRLLVPRSRSLSAGASSAADTSTRQRRKTVTFDEWCDVVEFDRESHEGSMFETDDEDVFGRPERRTNDNVDSRLFCGGCRLCYGGLCRSDSFTTPYRYRIRREDA